MAGSERFEIRIDDLHGPEIVQLLAEHLEDMAGTSPPESVHALDLPALRRPDITFFSVWHDGELSGCGAIRELGPHHGEIKSMRTAMAHRRKGVAASLLSHLVAEASTRGYLRLSLETGSMPAFDAARALYRRFGFVECEPFADYTRDPNSVFMTRLLSVG